MVNFSTESVARAVREYAGVTRKQAIGEITRLLRIDSSDVVVSFGDDAALIRNGDDGLLLAADGIWSRLMEADPYWAGFCAVLVNVHDIAAMGGRPVAMVDVFSINKEEVCREVLRGMADASQRFGVPVVGGHVHPDAEVSVIDVAILGVVNPDDAIFSHTAMAGDRVIAAIDTHGRVHPSCIFNWDSVTDCTAESLRAKIATMHTIGRERLATAGKDISNPGVIGTLAMLLETSQKGAVIDLDAIPRPDLDAIGITFEHWVRMYPGMGFVLTAPEDHVERICSIFWDAGIKCADIGFISDSLRLTITSGEQTSEVFDLANRGVMGLKRG